MERYQGKVFGDFASRFSKELYLVKKQPSQAVQAQGEIKAAEDFLEGRTQLGSSPRIEGLAESKIQGVETPEFRVTGADGITRLAEVKTLEAPLSKNNIDANLKKAISQIKTQALETGERGAYIRIDGQAQSTTLTRNEIIQYCQKRLTFNPPGGEGATNFVEFVEVLYKDVTGQSQRLLIRVQNGNVVIFP